MIVVHREDQETHFSKLPPRAQKEIVNFLAGMREADAAAEHYERQGDMANAKRKADDADWYWLKAIERGYLPWLKAPERGYLP